MVLTLACGGGGGGTSTSQAELKLSVSPASANLAQGQAGTVQVSASRLNGETGAITLSLGGAPAGLTGSGTIASGATAATFTVQVGAAVAAGTYALTVQGSDGTLTRSTTFNLVVTAAKAAVWVFDPTATVTFFAYQDGTGAWTPVPGSFGVFAFNLAQAKGGVAYAITNAALGASEVVLYYGTAAELASQNLKTVTGDGLTVTGTFSGLGGTDKVDLYLGMEGYDQEKGAGTGAGTWTMAGMNKGVHDLLAMRSDTTGAPQSLIIHRGLALTAAGDQGAAAKVNFDSEGYALTPGVFSVTGLNLGAGGILKGWQSLETDNGAMNLAMATMTGTTSMPVYAVAPGGLLASDRYTFLYQTGLDNGNGVIDSGNNRTVWTMKQAGTSLAVAAPADMAPTTATVTTNAPYTRIRTQWAFDSLYNQSFSAQYTQGATKLWYLGVTAAYGPVDLTFPDFTGLAGWQNAWGLGAGTAVTAQFVGFGRTWTTWPPADGAQSYQVMRTVTVNP